MDGWMTAWMGSWLYMKVVGSVGQLIDSSMDTGQRHGLIDIMIDGQMWRWID
jgi:hypothetical protein